MCNKKNNKESDERLFFQKVKESMLKLHNENPDVIEFQLFKEEPGKAEAFSDFLILNLQYKCNK